jgi:hypothetical protein
LVIIYFFVIKKPSDESSLTSSAPADTGVSTSGQNIEVDQNFIADLQSVKSIRLDDAIFSDPAFATLRDSSIILIPDGTEGRPNPFAPIGFENSVTPNNPAIIGPITPQN